MLIEITDSQTKETTKRSIQGYIEHSIRQGDDKDKIENLINSFGKLIERLAKAGKLTDEDIQEISGTPYNKIKFL